MEEIIVNELIKRKLKVSTAESCTGGKLAATLINISGSSQIIDEAHVTYSNEAKMKYLGVSEEVLSKFGAVSYECAEQMALGVKKLANADIGLSTTGIAGPLGGTELKPVGTVYYAIAYLDKVHVFHKVFEGSRQEVRDLTVSHILNELKGILYDS